MSRIRTIAARFALAATVGLTGSAAAAAPAHAATNYIYNDPALHSVGIGVGYSGEHLYEGILEPGKRTSQAPLYWGYARTIFIGAGFCAQLWKGSPGDWARARSDIKGPGGESNLALNTNWRVVPYKARSSSSCV
ncbi:hypothetical protein [Actinoplanes sp. G11-F43]|uniref:hypothetical protein n=1 Tax=Actinoplanes sp. G11-F43 TaxID=3424130 RepID=UPI003D33693A